jgi:hypothetical protein
MAIDFVCGFECRILAAGAAPLPDERHWDAVTGTPTISTATVQAGTAALRANTVAATGFLNKLIARRVVAGRFYFRIAAHVAELEPQICNLINANGAFSIRHRGDTNVLRMVVGAGGAVNGDVAAVDTWHYIDFLFDSSTGTASGKFRLNGGTEYTTSNAQTAADCTSFRIGAPVAATIDAHFDSLILGDATGDYPFGEGTVERMKPTRDGTHSFTAGDFRYNAAGANIATSASDVWSFVDDDDMSDITDFIAQRVANATGYVQVGFGAAPFAWDAQAVMVVSNWHASTTGANTVGMKMNDGGTLRDMLDESGDDLSDFSNTTFTQSEKLVLTAPSGGVWTAAKLGAVMIRVGYSGDVVGEPFWDGVMLEVAYGPARLAVPYVNPMPAVIAQ